MPDGLFDGVLARGPVSGAVNDAAWLRGMLDAEAALATAGAAPSTQVHTHLCYSEFDVVIDAIDGLDADVTSIEASRSRMEVIDAVRESAFARVTRPRKYASVSPSTQG